MTASYKQAHTHQASDCEWMYMCFTFGLSLDIIFQCSSNKFRIFLCTFDASKRRRTKKA